MEMYNFRTLITFVPNSKMPKFELRVPGSVENKTIWNTYELQTLINSWDYIEIWVKGEDGISHNLWKNSYIGLKKWKTENKEKYKQIEFIYDKLFYKFINALQKYKVTLERVS